MIDARKMAEGVECAHHAVFMEAIAPVGAAVIGAPDTVDLLLALLCGDRGSGGYRVVVGEPLDDASRIDALGAVQRDAQRASRTESLKHVQVIGDRRVRAA